MFSALASRLKPKSADAPVQDVDPATLPDADTVETQLLAAQQNGESAGRGNGRESRESRRRKRRSSS